MIQPVDDFFAALAKHWTALAPGGDIALTIDGIEVGRLTLRRAPPDLVHVTHFDLAPKYRGFGAGTRLMQELCDLADSAGCRLGLEAFSRPDLAGGGWLPTFYRKFGFAEEDGPSEDGYLGMLRAPRPAAADEEPDVRRKVSDLITGMAVFVADQPLVAALRPYRNPYAPDMGYAAVVLTDLFAQRPGQGAGSRYMDELLRRCDAAGLTLYTDAQDERSCAFYLARGFEKTSGRRDHQLVRWPTDPELEAPSP